MRRTQAERSETTIGELLEAAEKRFTERGYVGTSIEDIVRAAGVTRGALYHHFESKAALFRAVFERQQQRLVTSQIEQLLDEPDVWVQIRRGCEIYLTETLAPEIRQVSILDAPTALGWDTMREIESRYLLALLDQSLATAEEQGRTHPGDRPVRLHLLFGALTEAAVFVARAPKPKVALRNAQAEVNRLLDGFEVRADAPRRRAERRGRDQDRRPG
jgi:AcrR family transcriptional regulator